MDPEKNIKFLAGLISLGILAKNFHFENIVHSDVRNSEVGMSIGRRQSIEGPREPTRAPTPEWYCQAASTIKNRISSASRQEKFELVVQTMQLGTPETGGRGGLLLYIMRPSLRSQRTGISIRCFGLLDSLTRNETSGDGRENARLN
jgi:hypothetical protein